MFWYLSVDEACYYFCLLGRCFDRMQVQFKSSLFCQCSNQHTGSLTNDWWKVAGFPFLFGRTGSYIDSLGSSSPSMIQWLRALLHRCFRNIQGLCSSKSLGQFLSIEGSSSLWGWFKFSLRYSSFLFLSSLQPFLNSTIEIKTWNETDKFLHCKIL